MDAQVPALPYCAACLQDFSLHQPPCVLTCRHVYCLRCVGRLAHHSEVCCLYDGTVTAAAGAEPDVAFVNRLEYVRKFVFPKSTQVADVLPVLQQLLKDINLSQIPCRLLMEAGHCPDSNCTFSHSSTSLSIAKRFREQGCDSQCWECRNCLLTLAKRLPCCPVCGLHREEKQTPADGSHRKGTNATLDLSPTVEEDQGARESLPEDCRLSFTSKGSSKPKRSACCMLQ